MPQALCHRTIDASPGVKNRKYTIAIAAPPMNKATTKPSILVNVFRLVCSVFLIGR